MESDCLALNRYEANQPSLPDNKRITRWFPLGAEPRTALEAAILHLAQLAKTGPRLAGFEYWVQTIGSSAPLGFHVDKDEAVASLERYLLHPLWSSVFYVTRTGGGTLVTNQLSPNGNGYEPVQAAEAVWSFPEPNKFLLFNGTLLHGVVPSSGSSGSQQRITFLVNFWHVRPKLPNCAELRHEDVPNLRILSPSQIEALRQEEADKPSPKPQRQPLTPVDMSKGSVSDTLEDVEGSTFVRQLARALITCCSCLLLHFLFAQFHARVLPFPHGFARWLVSDVSLTSYTIEWAGGLEQQGQAPTAKCSLG